MQPAHPNIHIGTSNIVVPGNKDSFPPPYNLKSRLHYYSFFFTTIEVNQTFYKLPRPATFQRWSAEVKEQFQFTLKLSKTITHCKDLKSDLALIDDFVYAAGGIQEKKGCFLLQFPGKISLNYFNEVEAILEKLNAATEDDRWKKVVELRDKSWHTGETYELLNSYNAALVMQDMPKSKVTEDLTLAPFAYMRFHGPLGDYRGSYTDAFLEEKAIQVMDMAASGKDVYVYFNNTIGNAFNNACTLISMIGHKVDT
jgi:uncharacterized protein YecE (DUF72 family)